MANSVGDMVGQLAVACVFPWFGWADGGWVGLLDCMDYTFRPRPQTGHLRSALGELILVQSFHVHLVGCDRLVNIPRLLLLGPTFLRGQFQSPRLASNLHGHNWGLFLLPIRLRTTPFPNPKRPRVVLLDLVAIPSLLHLGIRRICLEPVFLNQ